MLKSKAIYSVYIHTFPNNKKYVGLTRQNPKRRWQNGFGYEKQHYMFNAIKKYGWENIANEVVENNLTKKEAQQLEIKLIKELKSNNRKYGYNISTGGETYTENFDNKRAGKDHPNARRIRCYDKNHNFIRTFDTQTEASEILGINRKGITKNCLGQSSTYKGYIFEYDDIEFVKPKKSPLGKHGNHHTRKVAEIDKDGKIIKKYNSMVEASKKTGIRANGIQKCCSGLLKTYHQRRWCYLVNMDEETERIFT